MWTIKLSDRSGHTIELLEFLDTVYLYTEYDWTALMVSASVVPELER